MQIVTDQFPGVNVIVRTAGLARYCSFEMSLEGLQIPLGTQLQRAISSNLAGTPNEIIRNSKMPYYWFIDDDHSFDTYHLLRLLSHDLPVVNGMTCMNKPPFHTVIHSADLEWGDEIIPAAVDDIVQRALDTSGDPSERGADLRDKIIAMLRSREYKPKKKKFLTYSWASMDKESGLKKVFACGLSGMLIKRAVFERIPDPWFELGQTNPEEVGEDVHFCEKLRKAGYDIVVDLGLAFGHTAPCAAWPCRLENGQWTIRLTWENGQSIVINRPEVQPVVLVDESKVAAMSDKSNKIVARTKEFVAGGLTEADAFTKAMEEAEAASS